MIEGIENTDCSRFLGMTLDPKLNWCSHVETKISQNICNQMFIKISGYSKDGLLSFNRVQCFLRFNILGSSTGSCYDIWTTS